MGRTELFGDLTRVRRIADVCERNRVSTREGLDRVAELEARAAEKRAERARSLQTRRQFLGSMGKAAMAGAAVSVAGWTPALAAKPPSVSVGVVGAGLAGLTCARVLKSSGHAVTVYDANDRVGGRCFSLPGVFPGQVAERGGEFIDTLHKLMLGYAQEFNLPVEDVNKVPGEVFYFVDGQLFPEEVVVDEYRDLVPAMRADLQTSSGIPTADNFTEGDRVLDFTSLREYLETRGAGRVIAGVVEAAYIGEYGREIDEQSCLNFLFFIHADRRAKFEPFGVYSDERYHVIGGNEQIPRGLAGQLQAEITLGKFLVAARKDSGGRVVLTFQNGSRTTDVTHDAVVFAIPFTTLRQVDLRGLALPDWKLFAINNLQYGTNAKLMVGFNGRPWQDVGGEGTSYAHGLANLQGTWETNPSRATAEHAILTDYTGGRLGERLNPRNPQMEAEFFLRDLGLVFAGASARATRDSKGRLLVDLWHWPSQPLWQGSYTCNQPGYFTTIADNEGKPVGNVYFAGEHANSFYVWQGFMEGAVTSGFDAANQLLNDIKFGQLG